MTYKSLLETRIAHAKDILTRVALDGNADYTGEELLRSIYSALTWEPAPKSTTAPATEPGLPECGSGGS